jgi:gliding motility-associated-like protein
MKKPTSRKSFLLIWIFLLFPFYFLTGQNVVNNGAKIVVKDGANVVIGGNYINRNDGHADGEINLDGNIFLRRNWINNSNNEVMVFVGTGPVGNLIMDGSLKQYIDGTHSSLFENLLIKNSKKVLNVTDCKVNDTLHVDAILNLNAHRLKILNSNPVGINYFSGYILSETTTFEGLGEIEWNIGSQLNVYKVPFGSGYDLGSDLQVLLETKTAGSPSTGSIRFATYPTGCQNFPVPPDVIELDRSFEYIADRFWNIDPIYDTKPDVGLQFHYRSQDINQPCNNGLVEPEMKAIRYNTLMNTWTDIQPLGSSFPGQKSFVIDNIPSNDFYAPWCLVSDMLDWEIFFPNAFTPNGDGDNDYFSAIGYNLDKLELKMYIYNRWGGIVYTMDDINKPWDGYTGSSKKVCPQGVYTWILFLKEKEGQEHMYKGIVTLVN